MDHRVTLKGKKKSLPAPADINTLLDGRKLPDRVSRLALATLYGHSMLYTYM